VAWEKMEDAPKRKAKRVKSSKERKKQVKTTQRFGPDNGDYVGHEGAGALLEVLTGRGERTRRGAYRMGKDGQGHTRGWESQYQLKEGVPVDGGAWGHSWERG